MQPQLNESINPPFRYIATIPRNGKLCARKSSKLKVLKSNAVVRI